MSNFIREATIREINLKTLGKFLSNLLHQTPMKPSNTKRKLNSIWKNLEFHASMEHRGPQHWRTTTRPLGSVAKALQIPSEAFIRYRPEVDILPGVTRKCSMRSAFSWFSEFCHSRRLSHFAASFIVTRAEASIAKSCERIKNPQMKKNSSLTVIRVIPWHPAIDLYKTSQPSGAPESVRRFNETPAWTHSEIQGWYWIYIV